MTTGVINTTLMALYIGGVKVAYQTGAKISFSKGMRETTSKDDAGWRSAFGGLKSATASGDILCAFDTPAGSGLEMLATHFLTDDAVIAVKFQTQESGDKNFEFDGILTQFDLDSPGANENVTASFTVESTGAVTLGTNP